VLRTVLLVLLGGVWVSAQPASPAYFLEREPVNGGAELVTLFGHLSGSDTEEQEPAVPLLSVLRDTLGDGDSDNARLRYVWILTSTRPPQCPSFGFGPEAGSTTTVFPHL
jgi:hypothetical protein